jgi:hypothetical protein
VYLAMQPAITRSPGFQTPFDEQRRRALRRK